jgi:hypothetical protein
MMWEMIQPGGGSTSTLLTARDAINILLQVQDLTDVSYNSKSMLLLWTAWATILWDGYKRGVHA